MVSPLHNASWRAEYEIVILLLKQKNININIQDNNGNTPLHYAAFSRRDKKKIKKIKKLLIEHGADVKLKNKKSKAPLD